MRILILTLLASVGFLTPAMTTDYPTRPVTIVVPTGPGGAIDIHARLIGDRLNQKWGQPVVVENVRGAAGNLGAERVAKAKPDGYTLLMTFEGVQAMNPHTFASVPFDPLGFTDITTVSRTGILVIGSPKSEFKTFGDMVAYAKAHPGELNYGTSGAKTMNHLIGELIKQNAGIDIVHVPHKDIAEAMQNITGGHVELGVASLPSSVTQVKNSDVVALGVMSEERDPLLPEVPTLKEFGLDLVITPWWGIVGPGGIPEDIVQKIATDVAEVLKDEDIVTKLANVGASIYVVGPDKMPALVQKNYDTWKKVVADSGMMKE